MLNNTEYEIGTVRPGEKVEVEFTYKEGTTITGVQAGCSCSVPKILPNENKIKVIYTAPNFPVHLLTLPEPRATIETTIDVSFYTQEVPTTTLVQCKIKGILIPK